MSIKRVESRSEIEDFIRFDWKVYGKNPCWIPPVLPYVRKFLHAKGRFFDHTGHQLFFAKRNGSTVAKLACFYDHQWVEHWKRPVGFMGFFEAMSDCMDEVRELFYEAESWLRKQGAQTFWGPMNGHLLNPSGLLLSAYHQPPFFHMNYNPSYYHHYFQSSGYEPTQYLFAYRCDLKDPQLDRKTDRIVKLFDRSSGGVSIESFDLERFRESCCKLAKIYHETYRYHWGYGPISEHEFFEFMEPLRMMIDPELVSFVRYQGDIIAFVFVLPDYGEIVKKLDGEVEGFLNGLRFVRMKNQICQAKVAALGVVKDWRGANLGPVLLAQIVQKLIKKGYGALEYSWVHAEDHSSQKVAKKFYGDLYKRYVIYEKNI